MSRKVLSVGLVLALTGAGLTLGAGTVRAQHGAHAGAFPSGSGVSGLHGAAHLGGFHYAAPGAISHPNYGSYHSQSYRSYYPNSWTPGAMGYNPYPSGNYRYPPPTGSSSDPGLAPDSPVNPDSRPGPGPDSPGYVPPGKETPGDPEGSSAAPPPADPSDTRGHITVNLPADAQLWIDGTLTRSTGTVRQFRTPPVTAGFSSYKAVARWRENGRVVDQKQLIGVLPGAHIWVTFPAPPEGKQPAPAANAE